MPVNAHLHLRPESKPEDFLSMTCCISAGNRSELEYALKFADAVKALSVSPRGFPHTDDEVPGSYPSHECPTFEIPVCLVSAGIHPWKPEPEVLIWLEELFSSCPGKEDASVVAAVGECGFDLYSSERKATLPQQRIVLERQLEIAAVHAKPVIFHSVRSSQLLFEYETLLKIVPSVIFHAWSGTASEAETLLRHGVNAWFSFGRLLVAGGKKACECVEKLPVERLLPETDDDSSPLLLEEVYRAMARIKNKPCSEMDAVFSSSFRRAYLLKSEP